MPLFNAVITGESTLSVSRTDLLYALGHKAFGGDKTDSAQWTAAEAANVEVALATGLQLFYGAYDWSFLRSTFDGTMESGVATYDLPDDFASPVTSLAYCGQWANHSQIVHGSLHDVNSQRERTGNGVPNRFAIEILPHSGESQGQRRAITFNAVPTAAYKVRGVWEINPYAISSSRPYPLGGQQFALCLRFACLSAWEIQFEERVDGPASVMFANLLARCKEIDQRNAPKQLGVIGRNRPSRAGETPLFTGDIRCGGTSVFGG